MRTQHDLALQHLRVSKSATLGTQDGVDVGVSLTVRLEGIVVPVYQHRRARLQSRVHTCAIVSIDADGDKPVPTRAPAFCLSPQPLQEALAKLEDSLDFVVDDEGIGGGGTLGKGNVLELVQAQRQDAGVLV